MGSPAIFSGRRTKLLTADGLVYSNNGKNDYDGVKEYCLNGHFEVGTTGWAAYALTESVTFTDAGDLVTLNSHNMVVGDQVSFTVITTTTGISVSTTYYVATPLTNTFTLASSRANALAGTFLALTTNGTGTIVRAKPVTGTGGSPTTTITRTTTTPISGQGSGLITKDAANRMGEGVSYAFTIEPEDKCSVMNIKVPSIIDSGSYTVGSPPTTLSNYTVWVYDVTNAIMIQPTSFIFTGSNSTLPDRFNATFQTSTSTSYRLILHCSTPSTATLGFKFEASVKPSQYSYGTPISDWQAFTPTGSFTTNTTYTGFWRRVGDSMEIQYKIAFAGAPNAVNCDINMPTGFTVDTTKLASTTANGFYVGSGEAWDSATNSYFVNARYTSSTNFGLLVQSASGSFTNDSVITTTVPVTWGASDEINVRVKVPVVGWSSSVQMSDQTDTRIVSLVVNNSAATQSVTANVTNINFLTTTKDTHGGWSSNIYTVPVAGTYVVSGGVYSTAATATSTVYKNGTATAPLVTNLSTVLSTGMAVLPDCKAGDTISIRVGTTITIAADAMQNLTITRVSGPSQIAANESVACKYFNNAVSSMPNSTVTIVDFATKDHDTHNAWTTGAAAKFTAPIAGIYCVSCSLLLNASTTWAVTEAMQLNVYKNGAFDSLLDYENDMASASNINRSVKGSTNIKLLAGEYIDIRFQQTSGAAITLAASGYSHVSIHKIGN